MSRKERRRGMAPGAFTSFSASRASPYRDSRYSEHDRIGLRPGLRCRHLAAVPWEDTSPVLCGRRLDVVSLRDAYELSCLGVA